MRKNLKLSIFVALMLLVSVLFSSCIFLRPISLSAGETVDSLQSELPEDKQNPELYETLAYIDYLYQENYVGDIDKDQLTYYLMNAYIMCVGDPYGQYYSPEEVEALFSSTQGVNVGIGVYVKYIEEDGYIKVLTAMDDSPAKKAGILSGDIITHVDGTDLSTLSYEDAVNMISGTAGSVVTLTIVRNGEAKITKEIKVTRNSFEAQNVFYHKYAKDQTVGIIRITEFTDAMPKQFKNAVNTLLADGCTSLVFDMRGNGGGTLTSCVEVLDFLLPEGKITDITDIDGTVVETYSSGPSEIDVPMAVLVDGNTASAAELFTCALKDYNKAVVVGTKTYGKGCMQTILELPNGGALRYTTQMYNPPSSPNYDGIGITPNIVVELDSSLADKTYYFEISDLEDNQITSAYNALKNQ